VHDDVEVEAGAEDVLAEGADHVGVGDGGLQPAYDVKRLAPHVDERLVGANREARDDDALEQDVGVGEHERHVLAGAGLGLVGVDDQVVRLVVTLRDEAPLHAGRESGATAPTQAGVLDQRDDRVGLHGGQRLARGGIAAAVTLDRPRLLVAPVGAQNGSQFHAVSPRS
jgi:hypothetical protein